MNRALTRDTYSGARRAFVLRLHLTRGVGPVLGRRLLDAFRAGLDGLRAVPGIGSAKARALHTNFLEADRRVLDELHLAEDHAARLIALHDDDYPALLAPLPDAPLAFYARGAIGSEGDRVLDPYPVAIVGSRRATPYGLEQCDRFACHLAQSGLAIVSGGARGIDARAHRAALRVGGRTIAVLGCGLARCYPPEHRALYDEIAERSGVLISELPMRTEPAPEHFPARNRIISGLALGVLVIEAPVGSGALITARLAIESHGREVLALPGRTDSPSSAGCLDLLRRGEAAIATEPRDVLDALESPARHVFEGTHTSRFASDTPAPRAPAPSPVALEPEQIAIVEALEEPLPIESLSRAVDLPIETLQAHLTLLEVRRQIRRQGSVIERVR